MIAFGRGGLWHRIKYRMWPSYRRKTDADLRAAIKWLVDNPDEPCVVNGNYIPHGRGSVKP